MKQSINLLPVKIKQAYNFLAFKNLIILLAITLVAGLSITASLWWQQYNLQQQHNQLLGQTAHLQNQLTLSSNQLQNRQTPKGSTSQLSRINQQIKAIEQVTELGVSRLPAQQVGFLTTLQTVQKSLPEDSSLQSLHINSDKSLHRISGTLANIEALPQLISNLEKSALLPTRHKINSTDNGNHYRFEIRANTGDLSQ